MARIHGIALVTLVLGGTALWLLLALPSDGVPEDGGPKTQPGAKSAAEPEGPAIRVEVPGTGTSKTPPAVPATKTSPGGNDVEKAPDLTVRVRRIPGNAPLPGFKWTLTSGGEKKGGTADEKGSELGLHLPAGTDWHLRLECDGHEPQERSGTVTTEPEVLEVFLTATAAKTGVSITARDDKGQPVGHVRVDAWRLAADAALDQTGATGEPLWSRRTSNEAGQYQLPTLEPGRYEVRAMAVDGEGALLPLLPFRARFEVTGSNTVALQADYVPGALLTLQPVDPNGTPLRGAADDDRPPLPAIELRVTGTDGKERDIDWRSTGTLRAVVERNRLVGAREVIAAEALPPGWLRITALVDGGACGAAEVMLLAGQHHKERLVILLRR